MNLRKAQQKVRKPYSSPFISRRPFGILIMSRLYQPKTNRKFKVPRPPPPYLMKAMGSERITWYLADFVFRTLKPQQTHYERLKEVVLEYDVDLGDLRKTTDQIRDDINQIRKCYCARKQVYLWKQLFQKLEEEKASSSEM